LARDPISSGVDEWARKWSEVVERLRQGPAPAEADDLLQKARDHVKDAKTLARSGSHGSALAFAEDAVVNCADAILRRDGWRVRGKTGGHQARFEYPALPDAFAEGSAVMPKAIDGWRVMRSASCDSSFRRGPGGHLAGAS